MRTWNDEQVEWIDAARRVGSLLQVVNAGPAYRGGFGHGGGLTPEEATFSAHVRHVAGQREFDVEVDTAAVWPEKLEAWRLVGDWLNQAVGGPDDLRFPLELRAERWKAAMDVDGVSVDFLVVGRADRWSASGVIDGLAVRISGSGADPRSVALRSISPEQVLDEVPEES